MGEGDFLGISRRITAVSVPEFLNAPGNVVPERTMAKRGPKVQMPSKSRRKPIDPRSWEGFTPPDDLDSIGMAEYERLKLVLTRAGTLQRTDPAVVVAACRVQSVLYKAGLDVKRCGIFTRRGTGARGTNPAVTILGQMVTKLRSLMFAMGLTLESKPGGPGPVDDTEDRWKDMLDVVG
jgi:P27 family predicted phage terminase small subunit